MRKSTFIFVFLQVQVEKTHLRDQHWVYEVEMQQLGQPELTCCVPNPPPHNGFVCSSLRGYQNVPCGGKYLIYSSFIASWAIKHPEQAGCTTHLLFLPFLLFQGVFCGHTKLGGSSAQVTRSLGKAPLTSWNTNPVSEEPLRELGCSAWRKGALSLSTAH